MKYFEDIWKVKKAETGVKRVTFNTVSRDRTRDGKTWKTLRNTTRYVHSLTAPPLTVICH